MKRIVIITVVLVVAGGGALAGWWFNRPSGNPQGLALHGNVDLRQVEIPFNNSERIEEVLVQEGDRVKKGQLLARTSTARLTPKIDEAKAQIAQAQAQIAALQQTVLRLKAGPTPEEVAQAEANVDVATTEAAAAERNFDRVKMYAADAPGKSISVQDVDNAKAAWDAAEARVKAAKSTLAVVKAGARKEDIATAIAKLDGQRAQVRALQAQLDLLQQNLADSELHSPAGGIVRTRVLEPGEMASPQKPVVALAIVDPKWVRAYVSEPDLGRIHNGMKATVSVDSFPGRSFEGWIGFISPVAEFTPHAVQTDELRTSLVYEVRVFVKDPHDELRLGMPATVHLTAGVGK